MTGLPDHRKAICLCFWVGMEPGGGHNGDERTSPPLGRGGREQPRAAGLWGGQGRRRRHHVRRTRRRVPRPFRGAVSLRGDQLCKKRGIFISSEIHFPVSRLRGREQINWEAAGRAGGGWKCRSPSEGKMPVPLVARAGSGGGGWDGAGAGLLGDTGHPSPGEQRAGTRQPPGRAALGGVRRKRLLGGRPRGSAESRGVPGCPEQAPEPPQLPGLPHPCRDSPMP